MKAPFPTELGMKTPFPSQLGMNPPVGFPSQFGLNGESNMRATFMMPQAEWQKPGSTNPNHLLQASLQAQQLDGAIRLLQMQYNAVMSSMAEEPRSDNLTSSFPLTNLRQPSFSHQLDVPCSDMSHFTCSAWGPSAPSNRSPLYSSLTAGMPSMQMPALSIPGRDAYENDSVCGKRRASDDDAGSERTAKRGVGKLALTAETACAIYEIRPRVWDRRGGKCDSQTAKIAALHNVTAKTIRDIWNRSTWAKATRHLWTEEEVERYVEQRKRMSERLDPNHGLPTWCTPNGSAEDASSKLSSGRESPA